MSNANMTRERLSIDILPEEHKRIKTYRELSALSMNLNQDPVLKKLWDNEKDAAYDKI